MGRSSEGPASGASSEQEAQGAAWSAAARDEARDHSCHADLLSDVELNTTSDQRDTAWLCSSSRGPAWAFLTAILGG